MRIEPSERASVFKTFASEVIVKYGIERSKQSGNIDALRIAHLLSEKLISMYGAMIGQDAFLVLKDWALHEKLSCGEVKEYEWKGQHKVQNPFPSPGRRIYAQLDFKKYLFILQDLLIPPRQPLLGRTPVTSPRRAKV